MSGLSTLIAPIERSPGFNDALRPDRIRIRMPRLAVGVFVLAAIVQKTYDATLPGSDVDVFQLYSEFTIQSNLVLVLVLIASAVYPRTRMPLWWDHLFGALVFYLVMTGLIYVLLVAPPNEPWWSWDMYWPQLAHHRLAPLFVALDWLLVTRTVHGKWWRPLVWLGYPVTFLVFSWVRGRADDDGAGARRVPRGRVTRAFRGKRARRDRIAARAALTHGRIAAVPARTRVGRMRLEPMTDGLRPATFTRRPWTTRPRLISS